MQDNTMAVSTSALKEYQKKVSVLYNEFIKDMNEHLREEKKVRKVFAQLRKEKLLNSQYSLYRSDGADLFSKATADRTKLMENFVRMSPVILDDYRNFTPWGLDMIIDEDLIGPSSVSEVEIRPLTAPVVALPGEEETKEPVVEEEVRPNTVVPSTANVLGNVIGNAMKSMNILQLTNTLLGKPAPEQPQQKQSNNTAWEQLKNVVNERNEDDMPIEDLEPGIDGHVDMKLDQTKARKIMIRAKAFEHLSNGKACVKLKEKNGEFILKPAPALHKPNAIQAYFMAKDPNKEQMALVRQRTSIITPTVSSDMKVNNKIPIMKSLLGHKVKKTTVSEIMSDARNRKTKHYKVVLRNYRQETIEQDGKSQAKDGTSDQNEISAQCSPRTSSRNKVNNVDGDPILSEKNLKRQLHQDLERHNMESIQNRIKVVMEAWGKNETPRPLGGVLSKKAQGHTTSSNDSVFIVKPPTQNDHNRDKLSSSQHRVKFIDNNSPSPLNRSASSMSFREYTENMHADRSPTDTMRLMVESKRPESRSESSLSFATGYGSLSKLPKRSRTPSRRFPSRFTPVSSSDTFSEISIDAPAKFLSTRDAHKMVKEQMKRDKEKESALFSLRRRMATASGRKS
ncbi:unnamed protein product [Mytilus coruscus]|uniref:Uncharacterized protein n=1 Tax=Mytilus coruscus TaxID=42192 RepID=A0A6J8B987_MYTCO|nr:unnamed protein product [Mytilus coruscus]